MADDAVLTTTRPYRIRSPQVWARAREDYLDGRPAHEVCARYDLGMTAFRTRAANGGWRRSDLPARTITPHIVYEGELAGVTHSDFAEMAFVRLRQALMEGQASEALTWEKVYGRVLEHSRAFGAYERSVTTTEDTVVPSAVFDALYAEAEQGDSATEPKA